MLIIGRTERITIKDISNVTMVAKIDTGAYSNSMHINKVEENELGIELLLDNNIILFIEKGKYKYKNVISSNGVKETRIITRLSIKLGNKRYKTFFTFTDRTNMRNKVLLGRKFIKGRYLVDVSQEFTY